MKIIPFAVGLILTFPINTKAQDLKSFVNYDCNLRSIEALGWIPDRVLLSVDADNKRARAFDILILQNNILIGNDERMPTDVKFKLNRRGVYWMQWQLTLRTDTRENVRVNYTARLNPQTNNFKMNAHFPLENYSNRSRGVGTCEIVKTHSLY